MTPDWPKAEPFAGQILDHLAQLQKDFSAWKQNIVEAERDKVAALGASLETYSVSH